MRGTSLKLLGVTLLTGAALFVGVASVSAQRPHREIWLNEGWNSSGGGWEPWSGYRGYYSPNASGATFSDSQNFGQFNFQQGQSGYFSPSDPMNNRSILVNLHVPPNAEVWFDGNATKQRGEWRSFMSPPVDSNNTLHYDVRARWTDQNGKQVERTRRVPVQAGQRAMVDFLRDDSTNNNSQQDTNKEQLKTDPRKNDINNRPDDINNRPNDSKDRPADAAPTTPKRTDTNPKPSDNNPKPAETTPRTGSNNPIP